MSAYIVKKRLIYNLISYLNKRNRGCAYSIYVKGYEYNPDNQIDQKRLANILWEENHRSVWYRYDRTKTIVHNDYNIIDWLEGKKSNQTIEYVESNVDFEPPDEIDFEFINNAKNLKPMDIFRMLDEYEYQACETPDWEDSRAYHLCCKIRSKATRHLPGYWDYDVKY